MDTSIVVETYNVLDGTSLQSVRRALGAATAIRASHEGIEILLVDVTGDATIRHLLEQDFPQVRLIDASGSSYDAAKMLAARQARGRYVVYLDCDCVPAPGWFDHITGPLRSGEAVATCGVTRYPGGFFSKLQTLMDFGFLFPVYDRPLGCYVSNNSAFLRELLLRIPAPDGPLRCSCYPHSQMLARRGLAPRLAAQASVSHERPHLLRERLRQGYDAVAVCWVDPRLFEARWLRYGLAAAPLFYFRRVAFDWRLLLDHRDETGLGRGSAGLALGLLPLLRLIDLAGTLAALVAGPRARAWFDRSAVAWRQSAHA